MMSRLILIILLFVATGKTFAQHPSLKGELANQNTTLKQVATFNLEAPQLN